jgi:hypothetical protein
MSAAEIGLHRGIGLQHDDDALSRPIWRRETTR